jgi:hypothetical protein
MKRQLDLLSCFTREELKQRDTFHVLAGSLMGVLTVAVFYGAWVFFK